MEHKLVEIELIEEETDAQYSGWKVTHGDKSADGLSFEEMIGLVVSITMPDNRHCLAWLKTEEQWKAHRIKYGNSE